MIKRKQITHYLNQSVAFPQISSNILKRSFKWKYKLSNITGTPSEQRCKWFAYVEKLKKIT
jgi:hypothetical protein